MREAGHDLAVVGARSRVRAQQFAAAHGVRRARGSWAEVLELDEVDAVYVALPHDLHEEWTVRALQAGKHVLCEKPLATTAAAAARMAAAAATSRRVLVEALMTRWHPRTQALTDVVRAGEIGEVLSVHAAFGVPMQRPGSFRADPAHGGGALYDLGCYGVAAARGLLRDEPTVVEALARRWPTGVDGATTALLGFADGALATVHASFESVRHERLEVVGTGGVVTLDEPFTAGAARPVTLRRDGHPVGEWRVDPYLAMVHAFEVACAAGTADVPLEESVGNVAALEEIAAATRDLPA